MLAYKIEGSVDEEMNSSLPAVVSEVNSSPFFLNLDYFSYYALTANEQEKPFITNAFPEHIKSR